MKWINAMRDLFFSLLPRSKYLYRIIWFSCIAVSVPIVLAASVYYQYSMDTLKEKFREDSRASVLQLKDRMESEFMDIEYESLQLAVNPLLRDALTDPAFADNIIDQQRIIDFLLLHRNSNSLIDEFIWYSKASGLVISNAYGAAPLDRFPQREAVERSLAAEANTGWFYLSDASRRSVSFVRKLPIMTVGEPQGVLIAHVRRDALTRLMASHSISLDGQTLAVLDYQNKVLLHSADPELLGRTAEGLTPYEPMLRADASSGAFTARDADGEAQLAVFQKSTFGRNYVSFVPEREMIRELDWIRVFVAYTLMLTLLVGILLMFIASRMAYSPIDKLIKYGEDLRKLSKGTGNRGNEIEFIRSSLQYLNEQAEQLNNYVKKTKPDLRDRFLLKLLRGVAEHPVALRESCRMYDVPTDGRFIVMAVKVENLFKEKRFLPNEGAVIVFAVRNVMLELLESRKELRGFVVERDDRETVAILYADEKREAAELVAEARRYAEEAREALETYLSFRVSIGIGGARPGIASLADGYAEAVHALQYRLFHDTDPVVYYEDTLGSRKQPAFNYPKAIEEDILAALSAGDMTSAAQRLNLFYERVRASESFRTMFQSYHVLLSSVIQSLEEKGPGVMDLLGDDLFEQLKARQTYSEVHDWFVETLFPLYRNITEDIRKNSSKMAIYTVCNHIKSDPGAPHTLTYCAELVGMSPSYLSRMFKQEMGVAFIEYVMEYKVEEAKKLLAETERSVTEIAEAVGYSERNLNRAFQRYVGMSPKQYRMSLR